MAEQQVKLKVEDITLSFGGVRVLTDVSFEVYDGEILAVIGPNGAGKTAIINCISGFYRPQKGNIIFEGNELTRWPPHKIAERGISRTFQNLALYTGLTTLDNLMSGRHFHMKQNILTGGLWFGPALKEEIKHRRVVENIIDLLEIEPIREKTVGLLPYGLRKRVELGRALALEPKLLLLDEPMAGMNVEEKEDMARFMIDVHELNKTSMILVEHDMGVIMDIADRVIVLDFGRKIAEGSPATIRQNPHVIKAYIGEE